MKKILTILGTLPLMTSVTSVIACKPKQKIPMTVIKKNLDQVITTTDLGRIPFDFETVSDEFYLKRIIRIRIASFNSKENIDTNQLDVLNINREIISSTYTLIKAEISAKSYSPDYFGQVNVELGVYN